MPLEPTYLWCLHTSGTYIPPEPTHLWNLHTSGTYIPQGVACLWSLHTLRSLHASGSRLPLKPTYSQEPTCLRESPASGAYILSGAYLPLEPLYYSPSPCCPLISLFISDPLVFQVIQSLHFFFIQRLPCFLPLWTTL